MKVKSLYEIYISFKLFETIGFHNQGTYSLSAQVSSGKGKDSIFAYPIPIHSKKNNAMEMSQMTSQNHQGNVRRQTCEYHTTTFNEQTFPFNGGCKFKLDLDASAASPPHITLRLRLNKYSSETMNQIKNMGTDTSQCILKESAGQIELKKNMSRVLAREGKTMSETQIQINLGSVELQSPFSSYRKALFTTHQYFSTLIFTVNFCKVGYKLRVSPYNLFEFEKEGNKDQEETDNKQKNGSLINGITAGGLVNLLKSTFSNPQNMFQLAVKQGISEYRRLSTCQTHLQKAHSKLINSREGKKASLENSSHQLTFSQNIAFHDANFNPYPSAQITKMEELNQISLLEFYNCESDQDLWLVLFSEAMNLQKLISGRWSNCLYYYSKQQFNSTSMHRLYLGFKEQIQYLRKNRYAENLQQSQMYREFVPRIRYLQRQNIKLPYMFKMKNQKSNKSMLSGDIQQENTLFILVHGFNGNQFDMSRIKSYLGCFNSPHFLVLRNISGRIHDTIEELGHLAADQITAYLSSRIYIKRLNFIGFSLGGVIIRAAIPHLTEYYRYFNMLITLSSPHLGVNELKSCVVRTGVSFLHKVRGVKNLKELTIDIHHKKKERKIEEAELASLEKLALDKSISNFKKVVFCGSEEDKYVPGYSSILTYTGQNPRIRTMQEQLSNIITSFDRISITFDPESRGNAWERMTGRRVHINFLDHGSFLNFLFSEYFHIF